MASPGAVEEDDGEPPPPLAPPPSSPHSDRLSFRCDLILRRLCGPKGLSVPARPRRQDLGGDGPGLHPGPGPHGPPRALHPGRRLTDKHTGFIPRSPSPEDPVPTGPRPQRRTTCWSDVSRRRQEELVLIGLRE